MSFFFNFNFFLTLSQHLELCREIKCQYVNRLVSVLFVKYRCLHGGFLNHIFLALCLLVKDKDDSLPVKIAVFSLIFKNVLSNICIFLVLTIHNTVSSNTYIYFLLIYLFFTATLSFFVLPEPKMEDECGSAVKTAYGMVTAIL